MESASAASQQACAEFRSYIKDNQLDGTTGSPQSSRQPFTEPDQLKSWWTIGRIRQALDCGPDRRLRNDIELIRDRYLSIFSTLVVIGRPRLIFGLLQHGEELPFHPNEHHVPSYWHDGIESFSEFCKAQWQFCAPRMDRQLLMSGKLFHESQVLPFEFVESLHTGDDAATCKVKLYKNYNGLEKKPAVADQYFVLKTYRTQKSFQTFRNEVAAFKVLTDPLHPFGNIITFYGSYQHGNTYNIILEYADRGTLRDYWKTVPAPTRKEDIARFWKGMFGVVEALHCIHVVEVPGSDQWGQLSFQGIHQDIKPDNILVCSGSTQSPYDVTFKIADLGLSHFSEKDVNTKRTSAPDTHGTQMYSAPELCRNSPFFQHTRIPVSPRSDIWSLGCVFSEAATWVVLGSHGRFEYETLRKAEIQPDLAAEGYSGCFHDGYNVLQAVKDIHLRLKKERRLSDNFTDNVIKTIHEMLYSKPLERLTALQLKRRIDDWMRKAEDSEYPPPFRTTHSRTQPNRSSTLPYQKEPFLESPLPLNRATPPQSPFSTTHPTHNTYGPLLDSSPIVPPNGLGIDSSSPTGRQPVRNRISEQNLTNRHSTPHVISSASPQDQNGSAGNVKGEINDISAIPAQPRLFRPISSHVNHSQSSPRPLAPSRSNIAQSRSRTKRKKVSVEEAIQWTKTGNGAIDDILHKLEERDHVFLIDNSASMQPHWKDVKRTFKGLASVVSHADPDKLDVYFTNCKEIYHKESRKWGALVPIFDKMNITGVCDMRFALQRVVDDLRGHYDVSSKEARALQPRRRSFMRILPISGTQKIKRGLNVYVFTDGVWEGGQGPVCGVELPIRQIVSNLTKNGRPDVQVGIQFIRFGSDDVGKRRLDILDSGLMQLFPDIVMDIVDTTEYNGDVIKMLVGAIDRFLDDDEDELPTNYASPSFLSV